MLATLLASSGFVMEATAVLSYYGISTQKQLRPLVDMIKRSNAAAKIIVHRDRDYLNDIEAEEWRRSVREVGAEPFLTAFVDVEGYFLNPEYLAAANPGTNAAAFDEIVNSAIAGARDDSVRHYVNGRVSTARSAGALARLNHGDLALEAAREVDGDLRRWAHGKTVLKRVKAAHQTATRSNLRVDRPSPLLADADLTAMSSRMAGR